MIGKGRLFGVAVFFCLGMLGACEKNASQVTGSRDRQGRAPELVVLRQIFQGEVDQQALAEAIASFGTSLRAVGDTRFLFRAADREAARRYLEGILSAPGDDPEMQLSKVWAAEALARMDSDSAAMGEYESVIRGALGARDVDVNAAALFALSAVGSEDDAELLSEWAARLDEYAIAAAAAMLEICVPQIDERIRRILEQYQDNKFVTDSVTAFRSIAPCADSD